MALRPLDARFPANKTHFCFQENKSYIARIVQTQYPLSVDKVKTAMQKEPSTLVPIHWLGFGYAALVASGGIIGYAKAGSVPSLAAGLFFGGLAGLGAYQLSQDPRNIWVFLATSGTLAGIMGMRFYNSGKFMPAGLIAGASLLMVAKLGISVLSTSHKS
ncbi:PREDICTED: transmembrane protein 14C [Elephantulus edwardii]|uniref:transmembrane protein 14C n=1 Tax=Elephantulus edwardii TaxID=28737 RepID=UPI0003F07D8D|nr:PREDICTED: transmembrane protein 14C [Elephantulus edwardii]